MLPITANSPGEDTEVLSVELFEANLDAKPVFDALSYTWDLTARLDMLNDFQDERQRRTASSLMQWQDRSHQHELVPCSPGISTDEIRVSTLVGSDLHQPTR